MEDVTHPNRLCGSDALLGVRSGKGHVVKRCTVIALGALLVALAVAGPASAAKRGGTFEGMFATDVDFVDPSLAYYAHSMRIQNAIGANLVRFADAEGAAGSRLVPEVASFPLVSSDGRTYTFRIRKGFRFSNGKPVTARNFAWAINRALAPQQQSPGATFLSDLVGAQAVVDGKARAASGVRVLGGGSALRIRLTRPSPDLMTRLALPFFQAIDTAVPVDAKGVRSFASAGPYRIASWTPNVRLVLTRNPYYKRNPLATRPANVDRFDFQANVSLDAQLLKVKAGEADYGAEGVAPTAHADLARQYGINKGRYQVRQVPVTQFIAINTTRGIFRDPAVRKAVNLAIDRQAILSQRGYLAGKRADQILPPGIPGFRDFQAYPLRYSEASVAKAKQLMRGRTAHALMLAGNRGSNLLIPQIVKFNLAKIGIDLDVRPLAAGPLAAAAGTKGEPFELFLSGWQADYPDPNAFMSTLLDGTTIRESNNNNVSYFDVGKINRRLHAAAGLSGAERYRAFASLDREITLEYAPWAALSNPNSRDFVSARVGCYGYHPTYGLNLVTVCLK
jgi:ABC-type transport system substrate-binding protein